MKQRFEVIVRCGGKTCSVHEKEDGIGSKTEVGADLAVEERKESDVIARLLGIRIFDWASAVTWKAYTSAVLFHGMSSTIINQVPARPGQALGWEWNVCSKKALIHLSPCRGKGPFDRDSRM